MKACSNQRGVWLGWLLVVGLGSCDPTSTSSDPPPPEPPPSSDGQDASIGSCPTFVLDSITVTPPGQGLDVDGDGTPDGAINRAWDPMRAAVDNALMSDVSAGETMLAVEICGIEQPYQGDDTAVTLKLYPSDDADTDPTNNFCGEPGCGQVVPQADDIEDGQSIHHSAPTPLVATLFEAAMLGVYVIDPGDFNLPLNKMRVRMWIPTTLRELVDGTLCGVSSARELHRAELPVCEWLPLICLNPSVPETLSMAQYMVLMNEQPELDVDGDGAERFELDDRAQILRCHDGDGRIIEGPDCLDDPGMVDGYVLCIDLHGVRGELLYTAP